MYWSGCQSTGAEMRKYLTAAKLAHGRVHNGDVERHARCSGDKSGARTVIYLLQGDDAVRRQALLGVMI